MASLLKCLIPTIGSPAMLNGQEGRYALAAFYGELLGMKIVNEGWLLIAPDPPGKFYLALDGDGWSDRRPPRWPDPDHPQQLHLDVHVPDLETSDALVTRLGATLLRDGDPFRVYADPAGHPFCLYPDPGTDRPVVRRLVIDCLSPRSLAYFYEGFLQTAGRVEDSPERIVIDLDDELLPQLAFQHAQFRAARWPDPDYPAQLHVDYRWHDSLTARSALERAALLGAVDPPIASPSVFIDPAGHPYCIQNEVPTALDIAGLYLNPPQYAIVYCVDQAAPMSWSSGARGLPEAEAADLTGLLAGLDDADSAPGAAARVTALLEFLTMIDSAIPAKLSVNLVCDWDDTYEAAAVQDWLAERNGLVAHRNPPEFAWSDRAGHWIAEVADDLRRRDDHRTAEDLRHRVRSWARSWERDRRPFLWVKETEAIRASLRRLVSA